MSMDFTAELAQFNPDPALLALLENRFLSLTEQAQHNADLLRLANLKNAALIRKRPTHPPTHLPICRIRW